MFNSIEFVYVWDLPGSNRILDMDFPLTYGDGLTLYMSDKVLSLLRYDGTLVDLMDLVESINKIQQEKGNFLLAF